MSNKDDETYRGDGFATFEVGPLLPWVSQLAGSSRRHWTPVEKNARSTEPPNS